ncbi:MAG: phosphohistidine phosphatase SixA [Deltaproteobacteria bacterium]|nr:phosphohistidine phosphatase SixA [Deltaproteobacteria bacterium]MBW2017492.1 phosphohistidine phosphatase SixA [Deltaproteobacteria bacterium]MBW2130404.1 phosphohistidine phosphatase SixA [Deltaproteobacteria bacterium]MBW2304644.1 phosphohistidine phosphatase SixA [Deltaproteobacteria bacterium]
MELYLMQHGMALDKEKDPAEHLSEEGRLRIQVSARAMNRLGIRPDLILASPKERSRETATIVARELDLPSDRIIETEKVKAMTPPEETLSFLEKYGDRQAVLITGHLPSLARIASRLISGGDEVSIRIENGGILRIDVETPWSGTLHWYLPPLLLERISRK